MCPVWKGEGEWRSAAGTKHFSWLVLHQSAMAFTHTSWELYQLAISSFLFHPSIHHEKAYTTEIHFLFIFWNERENYFTAFPYETHDLRKRTCCWSRWEIRLNLSIKDKLFCNFLPLQHDHQSLHMLKSIASMIPHRDFWWLGVLNHCQTLQEPACNSDLFHQCPQCIVLN